MDYKPSKYQSDIYEFVTKYPFRNMIINAGPGSGKCLGKDTPILMHNGTIKKVQDIVVGDKVMGPDSGQRLVVSTTSGIDNLYEIIPVKGDSFVCNSVHVLTLVHSGKNTIYDIPLNELGFRYTERLKLFRVGVDYENSIGENLPFDPYLVGVWLGDGTVGEPQITNSNNIIVKEIDRIVNEQIPECHLTVKWIDRINSNSIRIALKDKKGNGLPKNNFRRYLRKSLYINGEKRIPHQYLVSSRENRLRLLAGLLDTDGSLGNGYFEITTKYKGLEQDILHLARGLGFAAYAVDKIATIKSLNFSGLYYRITISGHVNKIPTLAKVANKRKQIKNVQRTGFSVKNIGVGKYYGFELSGPDGRFLLGDFTVTHNTSTLVGVSKIIKETQPDAASIFLAFNVPIAKELGSRLDGFTSKTINSLFFSYFMKHMGFVKANTNKYWDIVRASLKAMNIYDETGDIAKDMEKVVRIVRATLTDIDSEEEFGEVADIYDLKYEPALHDAYKAVLEYGLLAGKNTDKTILKAVSTASSLAKGIHHFFSRKNRFPNIDFTDQLWIPYLSGWIIQEFDNVLCDELQDLNNLQFECILRTMKPNARFIGVGDENQAIYLFAGSASDGMSVIAERLNAKMLPLSVVYRCPTKHIALAQKIKPDLESPEWAQEGILESLRYEQIIDSIRLISDKHDGDVLVVCRRNAPLVDLAYSLLKSGITFVLKGRDFGRSIERVIEQICLDKNKKQMKHGFLWEDFPVELNDWYVRQMRILDKKEADRPLYISLTDKYDSIGILYQNSTSTSPFEFIKEIKEMFPVEKDDSRVTTLCTGHKAKGLERDAVFVLEYDKLPLSWRGITPEQEQQESNLKLVAITRSKHYMALVASKEKDGEDEQW